MKAPFLLLLIGIFLFADLSAASDITFKNLGIKEGLSHGQVNHIAKDSRGFMWFSTASGLNRYDGYTFKVFVRTNAPYSLTENYINHVQEDADGFLWIHTGRSGYLVYNPDKETFEAPETMLQQKYGIAEAPTRVYVDRDKNVWFHRDYAGTHHYNIESKELIFFPINEDTGLLSASVTCISEDAEGIIYVYENGTIDRLDRNSNRIIRRDDFLTRMQGGRHDEYAVFVDRDNDWWVYTNDYNGLWIYYTKEDRWEHITTRKDSPYVLNNNTVSDIKQDNKGLIWVATDHGGINLINKELYDVRYLMNDPFDERSIIQNSLNCLFCDDNGIVWAGTHKRGVSYYNESIYKFKSVSLSEFNHIRNFTADVNVMTEDKQGNLWAGTNSNGLLCLSSEAAKRKIYRHHPDINSLSSNVIVSLLTASDGRIWAGTYQGGLNVFDGLQFTHYRHNPDNPNSLANDNIWALAESPDHHIWIGTLGNGLQKLDPKTGLFTSYAQAGSGFDRDYIMSMIVGKDKNLYMSTSEGISVFSPSTGTFERWTGNRKGTQRFSHQNTYQIYEDSRGLFWIATQEGLNVYDRRKDEIVIPNEAEHGSEVIHGIVEDNNRNMWITTASGIMNIVVNIEPKAGAYTYTTYRYNEQDGLQNQEFNLRSIIKTFRGEIIAGGVQGLSLFDPDNIKYNYSAPKAVFTQLQLFNEEVKIDSVYDGNRILTRALHQTPKIKLKHKQNVFSVSFSSMNYILPEKNRYEYMLEGFNTNWLIADANKVTYTNLAPGSYTLKVSAINSDGFRSDEISELEIVIRPPFLLSRIAFVLYFILFAGMLLLARMLLLRGEQNRFRLAQIERESQQKHELDDMKLRFFTNISHELRTPLTLIISPLENVIKITENKEQKQKLDMVHRNAVRLLNMVNQLLDFRKSDVKGHQLNPAQGDIVEFIRSISASFTGYSEKRNVHLTFFSAIKELSMVFDEDKMGKIIMNLLTNAFKFTPEGGRVDISIRLLPPTEKQGEVLEIKVSDTGIGISDEDKERIFERFYQVQHKDGGKVSGSGVGLHLVREFVALHQGTVGAYDNVGQGSVFIVTLPVTRAQAETVPNEAQTEEPAEEFLEEENTTDKRPVILVVDDNDDFRRFMKDSLKSGYAVKEASDGAKAWALIPSLQPDIIVSDVMMPEMDGIELCKLVKTDIRTSHIPLILLTARSGEEQKLEGLETGADDYITKPFNFDILSLRIRKLLQLRQHRQEILKGQMEINPSEIAITSLDEKLMQKAIQYVEDHIARSELSVEELSRELGMSRVHLYKKMLSITGKSPIEFIRVIRLKRAAQLLRESQQNVSEIAYQVGFNSPKYFSKYFKDEFGVLPSEYKN